MRRLAERIERDRAKILRQPVDDAAAEPVERMVSPVAGFRAGGESAPAHAPGHADEDDGADLDKRALPLALGERERAARRETGARDGGKNRLDRRGALMHHSFKP